jgi:metal-responsive CopG/Arc/MetJ family transcriptional regulator
MIRGNVRTKNAVLVSVWMPIEMLQLVDSVVRTEDSDRSKVIRRALRHKLRERGFDVEETK